MRLPLKKEGSQEIDKEKAEEMVDYALSHGVNYFDTAYMYHDRLSEPFIGEALSNYDRSRFNMVTKMPLMMLKSEDDVERIFNEQLQKCRVKHFDFYLLHNISVNHLAIAESLGVYEKLKEKQKQGLIRRLGFSFHDRPELLAQVVAKYDWDFAQIQCNYLDWELQDAKTLYQILEDKGIPVTIMEPVRGGALASLCEESIGIYKAANPQASPASWALRFAASLPGVQTVLSGMSNLDQVKDNIGVFENFKTISEDEKKIIAQALEAYRKSAVIPCTACRYCMDCPAGVEIPKTLAVYNNYLRATSQNHPMAAFLFDMEYQILGVDRQADLCVNCGQCTERCPQKIEIPRFMSEINALKESRKNAPAFPHKE
jgi:predicted aldo/keto reductase-like oxidoreductase